jgi:hypothetical protein
MIDHNLISTKTPEQIAMMREAGKICAQILSELTAHVKPGVTSQQINDIAYDLIVNKYGAQVDREDLSGYDASQYACISIAHNEIAFYGEPSKIPLRRATCSVWMSASRRKAGAATPSGCGSWATRPRPGPACSTRWAIRPCAWDQSGAPGRPLAGDCRRGPGLC